MIESDKSTPKLADPEPKATRVFIEFSTSLDRQGIKMQTVVMQVWSEPLTPIPNKLDKLTNHERIPVLRISSDRSPPQ